VPRVIGDFLEAFGPVVAAPGEYGNGGVFQVGLYAVPSNLISCSQRSPLGTLSIDVASAGSMKPG
jgi:hypothetical protein